MKEIYISEKTCVLIWQLIVFLIGLCNPNHIPEYMICEIVLYACHKLIDIREAIEKKGD